MAFSLITGLIEWLQHKEPVKILILGLGGAGKTSILYSLQDATSDGAPPSRPPPQPTVGLNLGRVELGGVPLTLWDVGGGANLRRLWPDYYAEAQAVTFVVDAGDRGRWAEAKGVLEDVLAAGELQGKPLLILARAASPEQSSQVFDDLAVELGMDGLLQTESRQWRMEVVAPGQPDGVTGAFDWLAKAAGPS